MDAEFRSRRRGSLGVRLWLADLAAGLRISRAGSGATSSGCIGRCASIRSIIAARRSGPASCSASISAAPAAASPIASRRSSARRRSPICAAASRPRRCTASWCAASGLRASRTGASRRSCYAVDRGHPQYAGRLSHDRQLHIVRQGHGRSGNNRDYVIETVKALEALNITRSRSACAGGAPERLAGRARLERLENIFSRARNDQTPISRWRIGRRCRIEEMQGRSSVVGSS